RWFCKSDCQLLGKVEVMLVLWRCPCVVWKLSGMAVLENNGNTSLLCEGCRLVFFINKLVDSFRDWGSSEAVLIALILPLAVFGRSLCLTSQSLTLAAMEKLTSHAT
ncbi:hypothetical protein KI387_021334, partial [Taxus chinensis]